MLRTFKTASSKVLLASCYLAGNLLVGCADTPGGSSTPTATGTAGSGGIPSRGGVGGGATSGHAGVASGSKAGGGQAGAMGGAESDGGDGAAGSTPGEAGVAGATCYPITAFRVDEQRECLLPGLREIGCSESNACNTGVVCMRRKSDDAMFLTSGSNCLASLGPDWVPCSPNDFPPCDDDSGDGGMGGEAGNAGSSLSGGGGQAGD